MRRPAIAVLLAALLALAGCAGTPTGTTDAAPTTDGSTSSASDATTTLATTEPASASTTTAPDSSTTTSTTTDRGTSATTTDANVESLPPGVTESGLANETALWQAHLEYAYAGAYEHEITFVDDAGNRSVVELAARENATAALASFVGNDSTSYAYFADGGDVSASWNASSPKRTYNDHAGLASFGPAFLVAIAESYPKLLLRAGDYAYDGTTTYDGEPVVRLRATGLDDDRSTQATRYLPHDDYESLSGTVLVTPDGFVVAMDLELEPAGGPTLDAEMTATRPATAVEAPAWLADVPDLSLSVAERNQYDQPLVVAVENHGETTVSAGATFALGTSVSEYGNVTLDQPLAPGETASLSLAGDATYSGDLGVAIGDPPSLPDDAPAFGATSSIVLTVTDGSLTANYGFVENETETVALLSPAAAATPNGPYSSNARTVS